VTVTIPSGTAQPTDVAVLAAPAPSDPATSTTQGPPGGPGNPGNPAGGNPPPQPQPTGATTTTGPPPPAWGSQLNTSIQVVGTYPAGGTVQLGRAEGWFQMHNDRTKFRYSFTFCRQSSYMLPTMAISVNGQPLATINPPYSGNSTAQPCYGSTATVSNEHGHPSIQNVYFKLSGSTFIGNEHVVFTQDRTFYNSN